MQNDYVRGDDVMMGDIGSRALPVLSIVPVLIYILTYRSKFDGDST